MTDAEALWRAVLADPHDPAPKLVLADLLDEAGDHDTARGLRWCAASGKWPKSSDDAPSFYLWSRITGGSSRRHVIPDGLWSLVAWDDSNLTENRRGSHKVYNGSVSPDVQTALRRLGRALATLTPEAAR